MQRLANPWIKRSVIFLAVTFLLLSLHSCYYFWRSGPASLIYSPLYSLEILGLQLHPARHPAGIPQGYQQVGSPELDEFIREKLVQYKTTFDNMGGYGEDYSSGNQFNSYQPIAIKGGLFVVINDNVCTTLRDRLSGEFFCLSIFKNAANSVLIYEEEMKSGRSKWWNVKITKSSLRR